MYLTAGDLKGDTARGARYLANRQAAFWDRLDKQRRNNMAKGSGIMKPLKASAELQEIVKEKKVSRGQAVKMIWKYIKKKGLTSEKDGRIILLDKRLKPLFKKKLIAKKRTIEMRGKEIRIPADAVFMTEIGGMLKNHLE